MPEPTPAAQLAGFVAKFDPPVQRLIKSCRAAVRKRLPTAHELVYDNYNFFVIGYSPTERPSDAIVSLAANRQGIGLCFIYGAALPDPHKILLGSGKQTRFVRLASARTLSEPAVAALLRAAVAQADPPLRRTGSARLIIKSVSKKQRPRR
ncbi:MAG TPA: hypothetical protein VLT86_05055 [Vicinamibacterales bacterium]|nr:hypothetical protein [Vicinamibacterales bacterium]